MEDKDEEVIKITLLGDTGSGKSSLLKQLTNSDREVKPNIGIEIFSLSISGKNVQITDADGKDMRYSERFSLSQENAIGIVIDSSKEFNDQNFIIWLRLIKTEFKPNTLVFVLINKNDLHSINGNLSELLKNTAEQEKVKISLMFSCSARTGNGIKEAFEEVVKNIINGHQNQENISLILRAEEENTCQIENTTSSFSQKVSQHKLLIFNLSLLVITLTLIILAAAYPPAGAILALGLLFPGAGSLVVSLMGLGVGLFVNVGTLLNNFRTNRHHSPTYTMIEDNPLTRTNYTSEPTSLPISNTQIFHNPQQTTTEESKSSPSYFFDCLNKFF